MALPDITGIITTSRGWHCAVAYQYIALSFSDKDANT